jgi:cell surface protein SprA
MHNSLFASIAFWNYPLLVAFPFQQQTQNQQNNPPVTKDSTQSNPLDKQTNIIKDSTQTNNPVITPKDTTQSPSIINNKTKQNDTTQANQNVNTNSTPKDTVNPPRQVSKTTNIVDTTQSNKKVNKNTFLKDSIIFSQSKLTKNKDTVLSKQPFLLIGQPIDRMNSEHLKTNPRYLHQPPGYHTYTNVDSSGTSMLVRNTVFDNDVSYPFQIGIDKYLATRKKQIQNHAWDSLMNRYDISATLSGGDIARMLASSTGLKIPIPPNPVMSLFGKPEISINVNGEVNLRVGWRWDSQNLGTVSAFGQTQSSPVFSQDIKVNVQAKIGDKLKLGTDWNTKRQFEFDNKFKIGYEGDDDEIVRLVELGNVQLPTQSTLIGGGQALFGVRADFQFGPLYLKTLASQKRGERKFVNVAGGTSKTPFSIRAYDFAKNHFFLDSAYRTIYNAYFQYSTPVIPASASYYRVKEIEVWESTADVRDGATSGRIVAIADLPGKQLRNGQSYDTGIKNTPIKSGEVERGNFMRLDSSRYRIDYNLGTLAIINMRPDRTYGVAYRIEGVTTNSTDDVYYGTLSSMVSEKDTVILKLITRPNLQPGFKTLWNRQMKNIYSINATNVNVQDTKIKIWYINQTNDSTDVLQGAPDKLVTIMRVDQVNNATGSPPPDGEFDLKMPFFDAFRGEITFPSIEPFRQGLIDYFTKIGTPQVAQQYIFSDVYDTTYDVARYNTGRDRFIVSGEVSGTATNRIALGAFNLAPGSVRVILNGVTLREYEDYIVDYYSGQLTMKNSQATLPNANLQIEYEQQDIFNLTTRTLIGLRADYQLLKSRTLNSNLGFTLMYYDQSAVVDRVRLGEEPVSNTMIGLDGKVQWDTPWLTKLLDHLPFYDTKAPSSIGLRGEWAMMLPEPNKRFSDVASDNGQPVVYIDDFEGAQRYISLGLSPTQWQYSSQPVDSTIAPDDSTRALFRGKVFWYQYFIPKVPIVEVYPNRSTVQGRTNLSPLEINFNPYIRGIYNKNPEFLDTANPKFDPTNRFADQPGNMPKIWGGFQRLLSSFTTNFDTENIEYIEIMMKLDQYDPGSKMYVDLGQISEDIIPDGVLDTEDGITAANPVPNGMIDAGEDIGIDAMNDAREQVTYPPPLNLEKDPAKDDYFFDFSKDDDSRTEEDFVSYNNFENNASYAEMGQFPDTEILNKNNGQTIFLDNSYFGYEVKLSPYPDVNPQIVGGGSNGWYLYRIPVRSPDIKVGNPLYSNIQYIRVWFKGGRVKAQIADWRLVGSHWERISNLQSNVSPLDSTLQVAFVNVEENSNAPDFYTMPPGVQAPKQLNNPDPQQLITLNEQSLAINVKNLRYGEDRMAVRFFSPLDIFYYKELKVFIHGDGSMPDNIVTGAVPKAYAYMRFGTDSMNYYEYRRPLIRNWQEIDITLAQLTAIKQVRDSAAQFTRQLFPVPGDPLAVFAIEGNPILTKIQFFGFGIANPAERYPNELTTTMWVDELRLINPESRSDWAAVGAFDMKLADLGTINASFNITNPNFHKLEDRFGDRTSTTNWTVTMQGNLDKFAPKGMTELKIPISYTHAEFMQNPEFVANSDINLEEAAQAAKVAALKEGLTEAQANAVADETRIKSRTLRVQDSWAMQGIRLGIPSSFWLITNTLNKLTFGYSYAQEYQRSPIVVEHFNWIWQFTTQYAVTIPELAVVRPFGFLKGIPLLGTYSGFKINFLPSTFSAGLNLARSRTTEQSRFLPYPSPVIRDFSARQQGQFSWKITDNGLLNPTLDYSVTTNSTMVPFELDEFGQQRTGSQIAAQLFFKDSKLLNLGQSTLHQQNVTINFKPRLPIGDAVKYIDMTGSFSTIYNWQNPLQPDPAIRDIAKTAGFNNTIRLNTGLKLKSWSNDLFGVRGPKIVRSKPDSNATSAGTSVSSDVMSTIGDIFRTIFFDYEKFDISLQQQNSSINPGVYGGTGMTNFWVKGLFGSGSDNLYGPSMPYQLGLVTDPHGGFNMLGSSSFPFFRFETYPGLRPPNAVMQDNFSQKTTFEAKTSRPLWEGATLDLNWRTELGFNKNQTVITDSLGKPTFTNVMALESFDRTYFTMPSLFGLNLFNNTIEHVVALYMQRRTGIMNQNVDTIQKNQMLLNALAESFHDGLQAFSFFGGTIGKFLPAINWGIRWEGLEKWGIWQGFAKRISFEHVYQSKYVESANITDNGRFVQSQQVQFGFNPLIGLTFTFDEKKMKGILTTSLRYNSTSDFMLSSANRATISRQATDEIQAKASYTLKGFDFPLFGLALKNDLEFSFLGSYKHNKRTTFDVLDYTGEAGRTLDGNTQITIEPRVRYTMSDRVTASFFMRYEGTFTEGAATPGFNTFQTGLDIRISIAGGR